MEEGERPTRSLFQTHLQLRVVQEVVDVDVAAGGAGPRARVGEHFLRRGERRRREEVERESRSYAAEWPRLPLAHYLLQVPRRRRHDAAVRQAVHGGLKLVRVLRGEERRRRE